MAKNIQGPGLPTFLGLGFPGSYSLILRGKQLFRAGSTPCSHDNVPRGCNSQRNPGFHPG